MKAKDPDSITKDRAGFLQDLVSNAKLILRLLGDPRVPILVKALPIGTLAYWLVPDLFRVELMMAWLFGLASPCLWSFVRQQWLKNTVRL